MTAPLPRGLAAGHRLIRGEGSGGVFSQRVVPCLGDVSAEKHGAGLARDQWLSPVSTGCSAEWAVVLAGITAPGE